VGVNLDKEGRVGILVLDRPPVNSYDYKFLRSLAGAIDDARNDEVVGMLFDYVLKDINAADLETRRLQVRDIAKIEVARDYVTGRCHALSHSQRDGSVARAEFEAAPARTHSQPGNVSEFDGIEQR